MPSTTLTLPLTLLQCMFFLTTVITLASELHCVCNTTFITIWGEFLRPPSPLVP